MAFTLGRRRGGGRGEEAGCRRLRKNLAGFLDLGPEDEPLQPANGGLLGLDEPHDPLQGAQELLEQPIRFGGQHLRQLGQQLVQLRGAQRDDLGSSGLGHQSAPQS